MASSDKSALNAPPRQQTRACSLNSLIAIAIATAIASFTIGILAGRAIGFEHGIDAVALRPSSAAAAPQLSNMISSRPKTSDKQDNTPPPIIDHARPIDGYNPTMPVDGYNPTRPLDGYNPTRIVDGYDPTRPLDDYNPTRPLDDYNPTRPVDGYNPTRPNQIPPPTCTMAAASLTLDILSSDDAHDTLMELEGLQWAESSRILSNTTITDFAQTPTDDSEAEESLTEELAAELDETQYPTGSTQMTTLVAPSECRRTLGACDTIDECDKLCMFSVSSSLPGCAVMNGADGALSACLLARRATGSPAPRPGPDSVPAFVIDFADDAFGETVRDLVQVEGSGAAATTNAIEREISLQYSKKARVAAVASEGTTAAPQCASSAVDEGDDESATGILATLESVRSQLSSLVGFMGDELHYGRRQLKILGKSDGRNRVSGSANTDAPWRSVVQIIYKPIPKPSGGGDCWTGACSGVMISGDVVVTAKHCLYKNRQWRDVRGIIPSSISASFATCATYDDMLYNGMLPMTARRIRNSKDLAFMRVRPSGAPSHLRPLPWGYESCPSSDLNLYVSGFPASKTGQWWMKGHKKSVCAGGHVYYNMDTSGGQSGGPVWKKVNGNRKVLATHKGWSLFNNKGTRHKSGDFTSLCDFIDRYSSEADVCP